MISESSKTNYNEANESQDEEKSDEKLTAEVLLHESFQRQIRDVVYTLIPEVPRLRDLYMTWESLASEEKDFLDEYGKKNTKGLELYKPTLEALKRWDRVQDNHGAPGCESGLVTLSGHPQIETLLSNVVFSLEGLIAKLQDPDSSCSELLAPSSAARLTSSLQSVYEEEKDRGDGSLEIMYQSSFSRRSLSLDNIPKELTKKGSVFSI